MLCKCIQPEYVEIASLHFHRDTRYLGWVDLASVKIEDTAQDKNKINIISVLKFLILSYKNIYPNKIDIIIQMISRTYIRYISHYTIFMITTLWIFLRICMRFFNNWLLLLAGLYSDRMRQF